MRRARPFSFFESNLTLGLVALFFAGCSGESSTESPLGKGEISEAMAIMGWDRDVARARCEREVLCGRMETVDGCLEMELGGAMPPYDAAYVQFFGGVDFYEELARVYELGNAATLDACLREMEEAACWKLVLRPPSCERALVPRERLGEGERCVEESPYLPALPCAEGLVCEYSADTRCSVCTRDASPGLSGEGGACDVQADCEDGFVCSTAMGTPVCTRTPGLGEACPDFQCAPGDCRANVCVPFVGLGETCGDAAACRHDLVCDGTCVARGSTGSPCTRNGDTIATQCREWCVFDTPDATEGHCGVPPDALRLPCARYVNDSSLFCPGGTYYDTHGESLEMTPAFCECLRKLPLGAECDATLPQRSGFSNQPCDHGVCRDGSCAPLLADGAACTASNECASASCGVDGTCEATCRLPP